MKEDAIGGKIEHLRYLLPGTAYTMVFLKDLKTQWPWSPNADEDLSDKEIYTHTIHLEDASDVWRVPILPPMNGFAFVGIHISIYGKGGSYSREARLVLGETDKPLFGPQWDTVSVKNTGWTPLGFPLSHKMIAITEDGLDILISNPEACGGRVELLAQRFEDILEVEEDISYLFLNEQNGKVEWVLNETNLMYKPFEQETPYYRRKVKLIPSTRRLFDGEKPDWPDIATSWEGVSLVAYHG